LRYRKAICCVTAVAEDPAAEDVDVVVMTTSDTVGAGAVVVGSAVEDVIIADDEMVEIAFVPDVVEAVGANEEESIDV